MTPFKKYCLGYTHEKCSNCRLSDNWRTLNQMPDALRKPIQAQMTRLTADGCRIMNMILYEPLK